MKKKVLHIISSTQWRGGEQQVDYIFHHKSNTVEYYLFCPEKAALVQRNKAKSNFLFTYKKRMGFDIWAALELKKVTARYHIDIVHLHDSHAINTYLLADLFGMDIPAVIHRHVSFPVISKWKYNYHKIKKIVCVSDAIKNTFAAFLPPEKLIVLHPGIEITKYRQASNGLLRKTINATSDQKIIGMVAALEQEKNITAFLNIAYQYYHKGLNHRFVIIGDGSMLSAFKTQYTLSNVHFLGFREDIEKLLPDMDVFLFTSVKEGFPLVVMEAMAAGVPVVTYPFDSATELIQTGKNGFIVRTEEEAIEKIELLVTATHTREAILENARTFVQAFDIQNMNIQLETVYKTI